MQGRHPAGLEAAGRLTFSRENHELIHFCWGSAHRLFFTEPRAPACEMVSARIQGGSSHLNPSKNIPHRQAYRSAYSRQFPTETALPCDSTLCQVDIRNHPPNPVLTMWQRDPPASGNGLETRVPSATSPRVRLGLLTLPQGRGGGGNVNLLSLDRVKLWC